MKITESFLKKILVDSNIVSQKDFNLAKEEAKESKMSLEEAILFRNLVSDEELGQLISEETGFPFVSLEKTKISKDVLNIVPEIVAKKQGIIVFERGKEGIKVAMVDPANLEIREFIERKTGEMVIPYYTTERGIHDSLKHYRKEIKEEFEEIIGKTLEDFKDAKMEDQSLPIIKMVDLILTHGYENRASDIHIEPYKKKIVLRYRIDGILHDVLTLPSFTRDFMVSRIKILARLRTDEHEAAQDGHFSFSSTEERVDIRVSVVPIGEGEKVVMRLLSEKARRFSLEDLGFLEEDFKILKKNIKKPWGMILIAGPTGCGKTTTLYGILKILNSRKVNICTIEDPIEYDVEGINQIQVNPKTNLNFSDGLRAIVRQDPDIIMVGEIRDPETAKLAVNAAMTGHLVLSTFHSNDASTTIPRLLDMGIEPFLITSTVNIIVAQRLVRKICPKCIESYEITVSKLSSLLPKELVEKLPKTGQGKIYLFRGKGCLLCQKTGYLGRIGIFELLEMEEPIKKLVMEKANASRIKEEAVKQGMVTMIEDGLKKLETGVTTIDEILRAVK